MIHREGYTIIAVSAAALGLLALILCVWAFKDNRFLQSFTVGVTLVMLIAVVQFFRNPERTTKQNPNHIIAPADGEIVIIQEVEEPEYFKGKRLQISTFMSPLNVHVNRNPIGGEVVYYKYHEGEYLVAWHPKSSTLNERTTVVVRATEGPKAGQEVLFRQIAGAVARRIVAYVKPGQKVEQGAEMGFIKFGSRVDVFLPVGSVPKVKIGDKPVGGETVLAEW